MGGKKGTGFRNSLLNKLDRSSTVKEAEKAEHLKTAVEGSWAEDETNKMQLESIPEKSLNSRGSICCHWYQKLTFALK